MNTNNYLPFDLETALAHPERVITRDGRKVKQIFKFDDPTTSHPIAAIVDNNSFILTFAIDGTFSAPLSSKSNYDLFLLPEPKPYKEWWVNVYENRIGLSHETKEMSLRDIDSSHPYIKTICINNQPE